MAEQAATPIQQRDLAASDVRASDSSTPQRWFVSAAPKWQPVFLFLSSYRHRRWLIM
jgi:hypothetical protein